MDQLDGMVDKCAYHRQAWRPEFILWNPQDRKEPNLL